MTTQDGTVVEETPLNILSQAASSGLTTNAIGAEEEVDVATLNQEQLRNRALSLRRRINLAAIELAEVLHTIYHAETWREYGFESFEKYVETELEIGYRSAMYSVRILDTIKAYNIPMSQAKQLGWGRLRSILPHITARNVGSLLEMASSHSVRQIQEELRGSSEVSSIGQPETTRIVFNCSASEAAIIFDAINDAKRRLNTESMSAALEFLASEWTIANEGETSQTSLQDIINFVERNYGVTLAPLEGTQQNVGDRVE